MDGSSESNEIPNYKVPNISIPVDLFCALVNAQSTGTSLKQTAIDLINRYRTHLNQTEFRPGKGHVCQGFYKDIDGALCFSDSLYMEAVYAGKRLTYAKGVLESIEKLKSSFDSYQAVGRSHLERQDALDPTDIASRLGELQSTPQQIVELQDQISHFLLKIEHADDR